MDEVYKSRVIRTTPQLNLETDCWIPKDDVSWREEGTECHQTLAGPPDRFKIIDEAEINALEMAKAWIDGERIDNLTP